MATRRPTKRAKRKSTNPTVEQLRQQMRSIVPEPVEPTPAERAEADDEPAAQPGPRKAPPGGWGKVADDFEWPEIAEEHFATAGEESQC